MEPYIPYIVGAGILGLIGLLVYAFLRPSKEDDAGGAEITLMGAVGGLAGAGEAAQVAEIAAAEESAHNQDKQ